MKRVTVFDTANGHAVGWDPDGVTTTFSISDTSIASLDEAYISVEVVTLFTTNYFCDTVFQEPGSMDIACASAPIDGVALHYVVENLPAHVIE
jgi:hypothetical protein